MAIVAGLGVVELWVVGLMICSVAGGHMANFSRLSAHRTAPDAGLRAAKTLETGPAPHVVIDDKNATLTVTVQPGTIVSVSEKTDVQGWVSGKRRPLVVERTADGVRIARGDGPLEVFMGLVERRLDVIVPPAARVDVRNAGSTALSGLRADAVLHSDAGSIVVNDQRGTLDVRTDDGRIELHGVVAPSVELASDSGRIVLDGVQADRVAVSTDDGRIDVWRSLLHAGKMQTANGHIGLELDPRSDVTVSARTSSGKVTADAPLLLAGGDGGHSSSSIRVGNGSGRLEVGSDDGSIRVSAGGV